MAFNLGAFISDCVIKRDSSMFLTDIQANSDLLSRRIKGKSVLVEQAPLVHLL